MNGDTDMKIEFLNKHTFIQFVIIIFTILIICLGGCEKRRNYNTDQKNIISNNQPDSTTKEVLKNNIPRNEEKKLAAGKEKRLQNQTTNHTSANDTSSADSSK